MSKQTTYIAKVRYSNTLPPPSCPPKLLKREDEKFDILPLTTPLLNFHNLLPINSDIGLTQNPLTSQSIEPLNVPLHPTDQILLTDPHKKVLTKSENVGFLRRTQYITTSSATATTNNLPQTKLHKEEDLDSKSLLNQVEDTFDPVPVHPRKLKAKRVWNLLPDTKSMDRDFVDVKFQSSASVSKKRGGNGIDKKLSNSLLKQLEYGNTRLISLYTTNDENDAQIIEKAVYDNGDADVEFNKERDYAGKFDQLDELRQLALTFDDKSGIVYYVPIKSKLELRKSRIDPDLAPLLQKNIVDKVDVNVREPTLEEIKEWDAIRSNYDPMEFGEN
ncbi:Paf1 protein [Martiniozyma asiatica (nom. inval.)]|nr:Paf1 protein [Martiniozyma asiatica]